MSPSSREERVSENERRLAAAGSLETKGERQSWQDAEFLCECRRPDCGEVLALDPMSYAHVHGHRPGLYFVAPDHGEWGMEAPQSHFSLRPGYTVVFAPRPQTRAPLDVETLKLQRDSITDELNSLKADVTSLTSQVTTATASAALILGVFGAVLPEGGNTVVSVLFAIALLPFVAAVFNALSVPDVSRKLEKVLDPLQMTFEELHEKAKEEEQKAPWKHVTSIATYEQQERLSAAIEGSRNYPLPAVLLGQEDWLIFELDKLLGTREAWKEVRELARDKRAYATLFLGALVVYLGVVAVVAAFL